MELTNKLTREQREAMLLLQVGTFLEYFDLMIYVHMAVVLNELFFPPSDPKTAAILAAFGFCSTYVLRPFGALIFGYIGDNWGRKPTVVITTAAMAVSCLIMANLPTYAEIGIAAGITVSILRIIQGMTSMGEVMGAHIYVSEITKPPMQYSLVSYIALAASCGSMAALGIATLTLKVGFNWRLAFWIGSGVALVGAVARTQLRETPDFVDAKRKLMNAIERANQDGLQKPAEILLSRNAILEERINIKSFLSFLSIYCGRPLGFYLAYIYFVPVLKNDYGYSSADIVLHNFYISLVDIIGIIILAWFSKKIYPLFISRFVGYLLLALIIIAPFILTQKPNVYIILSIQMLVTVLGLRGTPSDPIFIKHFPIFRRFTAVTFGYAVSRAITYVVISFGLVYLTEWFGYYGIWFVSIPIIYFWLLAIGYYESLEKSIGIYPLKGEWQVREE